MISCALRRCLKALPPLPTATCNNAHSTIWGIPATDSAKPRRPKHSNSGSGPSRVMKARSPSIPHDADAKFNHEFVKKKLEELKKQQQQQQQNQQNQQDKKQDQ